MLPYIQKLDNVSWWESEGIMFYPSSGCIPHGTVATEFKFDVRGGRRGSYPRGFNATLRCEAVYGSRGLSPQPVRCNNCSFRLRQGSQDLSPFSFRSKVASRDALQQFFSIVAL